MFDPWKNFRAWKKFFPILKKILAVTYFHFRYFQIKIFLSHFGIKLLNSILSSISLDFSINRKRFFKNCSKKNNKSSWSILKISTEGGNMTEKKTLFLTDPAGGWFSPLWSFCRTDWCWQRVGDWRRRAGSPSLSEWPSPHRPAPHSPRWVWSPGEWAPHPVTLPLPHLQKNRHSWAGQLSQVARKRVECVQFTVS